MLSAYSKRRKWMVYPENYKNRTDIFLDEYEENEDIDDRQFKIIETPDLKLGRGGWQPGIAKDPPKIEPSSM